jgi:hypothetical protein
VQVSCEFLAEERSSGVELSGENNFCVTAELVRNMLISVNKLLVKTLLAKAEGSTPLISKLAI